MNSVDSWPAIQTVTITRKHKYELWDGVGGRNCVKRWLADMNVMGYIK